MSKKEKSATLVPQSTSPSISSKGRRARDDVDVIRKERRASRPKEKKSKLIAVDQLSVQNEGFSTPRQDDESSSDDDGDDEEEEEEVEETPEQRRERQKQFRAKRKEAEAASKAANKGKREKSVQDVADDAESDVEDWYVPSHILQERVGVIGAIRSKGLLHEPGRTLRRHKVQFHPDVIRRERVREFEEKAKENAKSIKAVQRLDFLKARLHAITADDVPAPDEGPPALPPAKHVVPVPDIPQLPDDVPPLPVASVTAPSALPAAVPNVVDPTKCTLIAPALDSLSSGAFAMLLHKPVLVRLAIGSNGQIINDVSDVMCTIKELRANGTTIRLPPSLDPNGDVLFTLRRDRPGAFELFATIFGEHVEHSPMQFMCQPAPPPPSASQELDREVKRAPPVPPISAAPMEPKTPVMEPETPLMEPETPLMESETPVMESEAPLMESDAPVASSPVSHDAESSVVSHFQENTDAIWANVPSWALPLKEAFETILAEHVERCADPDVARLSAMLAERDAAVAVAATKQPPPPSQPGPTPNQMAAEQQAKNVVAGFSRSWGSAGPNFRKPNRAASNMLMQMLKDADK